MPDINSLLEKSKKKFKKSEYRPWNYLEQLEQETATEKSPEKAVNTVNEPIQESYNQQSSLAQLKKFLNLEENSSDNKNHEITHELKCEEKKLLPKINSTPEVTKTSIAGDISAKPPKKNSLHLLMQDLSGHQKKIFDLIVDKCIARNDLFTGNITLAAFQEITLTSRRMINTSVARLEEKNFIIREKGKPGRGGYYRFSIRQNVLDEVIAFRKLFGYEKEVVSSEESIVAVSPYLKLLPHDWQTITLDSLADIGFNISHLTQLYKEGNLSPEIIQESIEHFAFDIKQNNKKNTIKTSPISYFMGILKRVGYYNPPENYVSPKAQALQELLERKQKEKDDRDHKLKELINIYFEEWNLTLTEETKASIIPADIWYGKLAAAKIASLRTYFTEKIWPTMDESKIIA